jgi:hypothetical protein
MRTTGKKLPTPRSPSRNAVSGCEKRPTASSAYCTLCGTDGTTAEEQKRKAINKEIKYLAKRKSLMMYKELLDAKLPIVSGIVEAACKTLATERLKRSGMRWGEEGCQTILTLRSLIQSDRWEPGWELMANQYKTRVEARLAA